MKTHFIALLALLLAPVVLAGEPLEPRTLAGFGSSVCNGAGGGPDGGYIHWLQRRLKQDGWTVLNVSRGGDNTVKIQRRWKPETDADGTPVTNQPGPLLLPTRAAHVLIGLSLGNEGFNDQQFRDNLPLLMHTCRTQGMTVVIGDCYANGRMTATNYAKTRSANLFIGQLDAPSINFLGNVDDGAGRWVHGLWNDPGHPNAQGHEEMFHAIVPSLWRALEQGKAKPRRAPASAGTELRGHALAFAPADPVHAFAEVFWVKADANGAVATIEARPVAAADRLVGGDTNRPLRVFTPGSTSTQLTLRVRDGQLLYTGLNGSLATALSNDWNMVALSHWYARGETDLFVNGEKAGTLNERLTPIRFALSTARFRDWFVYRSALHADEVRLLHEGGLFQSSLEVYSPLDGGNLANHAQSLSEITAP